MKAILICFYFLAMAYSVSLLDIQCHQCVSINTPHEPCKGCPLPNNFSYLNNVTLGQDDANKPLNSCKGFNPCASYTSVKKDKEKFSCYKIDIKVNFSDGRRHESSLRNAFIKDGCKEVRDIFGERSNTLFANANYSIGCYECKKSLCNLGHRVNVSLFLVLIVSGLATFVLLDLKKN